MKVRVYITASDMSCHRNTNARVFMLREVTCHFRADDQLLSPMIWKAAQ
jgi:hypothetical protein